MRSRRFGSRGRPSSPCSAAVAAAWIGLAALGGCASSASLAQQRDWLGACRLARDETAAEQGVLRERLFEALVPRAAVELLATDESAELRELIVERPEGLRFARVRSALAVDAGLEAQLVLREIQSSTAGYQAVYVDDALAAQLVAPRPTGTASDLALVAELALKAAVNLTLIAACSAAGARGDCMGLWFEQDEERVRRIVETVDADPELRERKARILALAAKGPPLVLLLPIARGASDASGIELRLRLRARVDGPKGSCTHPMSIVVELAGDDLDRALEHELPSPARRLESLPHRLEWEPPDRS